MVSDEIMEMLSLAAETLNEKECALLDSIRALLADFDDYLWNEMCEQERRNWIDDYIGV